MNIHMNCYIHEPRLEELSLIERELFELYLETNNFKQAAPSNHKRDYIRGYVESLLRNKEQATILDLACGDANALRETKKQFGNNVYTVGVDIGLPPGHLTEEDLSYVDEYITTPMEFLPLEWDNRFDYISSCQGLRYTFFPFRALSEIARVLAPNSHTYIDALYDFHWFPEWNDEKLKKWEDKIKERNLDDDKNYTSRRFYTDASWRRFCAKIADNYHDTIMNQMEKIHEKYGIIHNINRPYSEQYGYMVNSVEMKK